MSHVRHHHRFAVWAVLSLLPAAATTIWAAPAPKSQTPESLFAAKDIDGLRELLASKDTPLLVQAADALGRLAPTTADLTKLSDCLDPLAALLTHSESQVRLAALTTMAQIVARLDDPDEERRFLGEAEPLVRDPVALVRNKAVFWIAVFKQRAARREAICSAAEAELAAAQDADLQTLVQAAAAAVRVGQQQHDRQLVRKGLKALTDALNDADPVVRNLGALALVRLTNRVIDPSLIEPIVPNLTAALGDANATVRRYAALTLNHAFEGITSEDVIRPAVPALLRALSDSDADTRIHCARALDYGARNLSDQTALRSIIIGLTAVLTNPKRSSYERRFAARGLASAGLNLTDLSEVDVVIQLLVKAKNDPDPDVRDYADEQFDSLVQHRGDLLTKSQAAQ